MTTKRPCFLVIMTDQQRADWLGCAGHPVLRTPHLDALAAEGTRFDNFHVASPICMPNRATFMTGRYPSVHGLRYNGCRLSASANTFVEVLGLSGYRTAAIGKNHLQPFSDLPPKWVDDGETGPVAEAWKPDTRDYGQESPDRYRDAGRYDIELPFYGFQHVDMVTGHGDRCGGHYGQWFRETAGDWRALHDPTHQLAHDYGCPQAYRTPVPEDLYSTAYVRDRTIDYLEARADDAAPFFLFVSFPDPHHPFNPPGRYWDLYSPDQFEVRLPYSAHRNPTPPLRWMYDNWRGAGGQFSPQTATMLDEGHLREAMALTAGMIACIDDAVGEIMAGLKRSGRYQETVICFTADHGDYLGDFNMLLKGAMPFRSITRVPFLWSDPSDRTGRTSDLLVSTVDLAPTILARAGIAPYHGMQGRDILPALADKGDMREDLLIEYNDGMARLGFEAPARVRALVSRRWRYTVYLEQSWGELYDLENDPDETHNLWNSATHAPVRANLAERLNHHLIAQMDESPRSTRVA